jgi:hypothetical protein
MAVKQFIRPEIIFVFIRVHSWLKTFRLSGRPAIKSVSARTIKRSVSNENTVSIDLVCFNVGATVALYGRRPGANQ